MSQGKIKLVYIVTDAIAAARSFKGQFRYMHELGYDVTVIGSPGPALDRVEKQDRVRIIPVEMEREISPAKDLKSLFNLYKVLREIKPDIIHAATPKASLLGMLSSSFAGTRLRYYGQWGLRLETTKGFKRRILWCSEWLTAFCAHHVLAVGEGLKRRFIEEGLASSQKMRVVGKGSANGVDLHQFARNDENYKKAETLRSQHVIPEEAKVIGFVGRLTRDKGIGELVRAFVGVHQRQPETHLLLVGDYEHGDPVDEEIRSIISGHPAIHVTGFISDTSPYYSLIDFFAFPSYREGLPNVLLEAAAAGLPIVASNCTGNEDILEHQHTGLIVDVGNVKQLEEALLLYLNDNILAQQHGMNANKLVRSYYDHQVFWKMLAEEYAMTGKLRNLNCPTPANRASKAA